MKFFKLTKAFEPPVTTPLVQLDRMTPATRIALWNVVFEISQALQDRYGWSEESIWHKHVWRIVFEAPLHRLNAQTFYNQAHNLLTSELTELPTIHAFFSETYASLPVRGWAPSGKTYRNELEDELNKVLTRYSVGFRFHDGIWVQVGSELENLVAAEVVASVRSYSGTDEKVRLALRELANPDSANYAAAVADAINSIEAFVRHLTGAQTLPKSLEGLLIGGKPLHPALSLSLEKLYSWTSNEDNQRHGSANASNLDRDLAKFAVMTMFSWLGLLQAAGSSSAKGRKTKN